MQSSRLNVTVAAAVRTQEEEASMRQDARVLKAMAQENEGVYAFDVANNGLLPYFFAVSFRQQPSRADVPC